MDVAIAASGDSFHEVSEVPAGMSAVAGQVSIDMRMRLQRPVAIELWLLTVC